MKYRYVVYYNATNKFNQVVQGRCNLDKKNTINLSSMKKIEKEIETTFNVDKVFITSYNLMRRVR